MVIVTWIVLGLVAGLLAQIVLRTKVPGGLITTGVLGIIGALLGGFIATQLGYGNISGFDLRSVGIAVAGAVAVLLIFRLLVIRLLFRGWL